MFTRRRYSLVVFVISFRKLKEPSVQIQETFLQYTINTKETEQKQY